MHVNISPNKTSPRNHKIDTITIHCVVGQISVESLGNIFKPASQRSSSNYGIGYDGRKGMYVEEGDRSWCSSSSSNDNRAITIEVASDNYAPYAITEAAMAGLIDLCTDICKRNDIKELLWQGDKSLIGQVDKQNLTVHRWFANKSCPGDYIYSRLGYIAESVNKNLTRPVDTLYKVCSGNFDVKVNADVHRATLMDCVPDLDCFVMYTGVFYTVQVGAYADVDNAFVMSRRLGSAGFDPTIISQGASEDVPASISLHDTVRVKADADTYEGKDPASFIYKETYSVDELRGSRAVLDLKGICTAFNVADLIKV